MCPHSPRIAPSNEAITSQPFSRTGAAVPFDTFLVPEAFACCSPPKKALLRSTHLVDTNPRCRSLQASQCDATVVVHSTFHTAPTRPDSSPLAALSKCLPVAGETYREYLENSLWPGTQIGSPPLTRGVTLIAGGSKPSQAVRHTLPPWREGASRSHQRSFNGQLL